MEIDPAIHAPARLQIVSLLAAVEEAEFSFVRDQAGVSDSVLSKHASALETIGYVQIRKGHVGKRPRTWLRLSATGRRAYLAHVAALQAIIAQSKLGLILDAESSSGERSER